MFKGPPKNIFYFPGVIFEAQISRQNKKGQCKVIAISLAQLLGGANNLLISYQKEKIYSISGLVHTRKKGQEKLIASNYKRISSLYYWLATVFCAPHV